MIKRLYKFTFSLSFAFIHLTILAAKTCSVSRSITLYTTPNRPLPNSSCKINLSLNSPPDLTLNDNSSNDLFDAIRFIAYLLLLSVVSTVVGSKLSETSSLGKLGSLSP